MIPFTGKCKQKQVVKGKPNPEGIKVFLMANPSGIPFDLYLYQGKGTTIESALYPSPEKLHLGGRFMLKLVDTLPTGSSIFIDRYFTSIPLLDNLIQRGIKATGTLMKNRVPEYQRPNSKIKDKKNLFRTDAALQKAGRGSYDCVVRGDKLAVIKWLDSKPIRVASTDAAVQPLGNVVAGASRMRTTLKCHNPQL
ncbi:PiggyBac transposable element-derived protein 2 [Eumeta japonica]|uniref:PiggyBac transposable element-derived protein 2 n=1 Tax=Eumeta variegata TaxID=151549 RepID=A0A4C1TDP1_EUMVA|nr:PiggyBac transposable element-derived protein 2 [Eumeta japonica]